VIDLTAERIKQKLLKESDIETGVYRKNSFRCSSLPVCPVKWILTEYIPVKKRDTFSTDFFAGIGTYVHEIVQTWLGYHGTLYGNWKCNKCKYIDHFITNKGLCDECGSKLEYIELLVADQESPLSGHVDGIIEEKDGSHTIIDFKTSKEHHEEYVHQIMSYWYLLNKYGPVLGNNYHKPLNIKKAIIFYIQRDNPWKRGNIFYKVYSEFSENYYKKNVKLYNMSIKSLATGEFEDSIRHRKYGKKGDCKYCEYESVCSKDIGLELTKLYRKEL